LHFVHPLPWWLAVLLAAAVGAMAYVEYRRPLAPLTSVQRGVLVGLRTLALVALLLFLFVNQVVTGFLLMTAYSPSAAKSTSRRSAPVRP